MPAVAREPWIEESVRNRLVAICQNFPGYTAEALWRARFMDWVLLADASDQITAEHQRLLREQRASSRSR